MMSPTLVMMAQQTAFNLLERMRKARRQYESKGNDPKAREQYEAAKTRLKDFLGSPGALKDLVALGDAEKGVVLGALANHLNATMALKSGNLGKVLPKPRQRAA